MNHRSMKEKKNVRNKKMTPGATLAFLRTTNDVFWDIEAFIQEHEVAGQKLIQTRKDLAMLIRSLREAYPGSMDRILEGGNSRPEIDRLEVERPALGSGE